MIQANTDAITSAGFTGSLIDSDFIGAYPILGFSYFIIDTVNSSSCAKTVELIRYMNWTQTDEYAVDLSNKLRLTTMPKELNSRILNDVMKKITCEGGKNAYAVLEEQVGILFQISKSFVTTSRSLKFYVMFCDQRRFCGI